jgi:hypothetical protein
MAAATSVTRYASVQGPIKVEYISGTFAATGDTVDTLMQNPLFAVAAKNAAGTAQTTTAISGKTVTVTDVGISASVVNLIVWGF